jgi:hypothetical protein
MAEATQYMFSAKDLLDVLIKQQKVHEGFWTLAVEFNFTATMAGTSPSELLPSAIIAVNKVGIQRTDKQVPGSVDAAVINPLPTP